MPKTTIAETILRQKYKWRIPAFKVDADTVGEIFEQIEERDGILSASAVVDEARPEASPIHACFEWDDAKAAERYRETPSPGNGRCASLSSSAAPGGCGCFRSSRGFGRCWGGEKREPLGSLTFPFPFLDARGVDHPVSSALLSLEKPCRRELANPCSCYSQLAGGFGGGEATSYILRHIYPAKRCSFPLREYESILRQESMRLEFQGSPTSPQQPVFL